MREAVGGIDVVFDGAGGDIARSALGLLDRGGRMLSFGMASGEWAGVAAEAADRGVKVVGGPRPTPAETHALTESAMVEATAGRLRPVDGQRFPLERAADAHAAIAARATLGKMLLEVRASTQ